MVAVKKRVQEENKKVKDDFVDGFLFSEEKKVEDDKSIQKIVIDSSSNDLKKPLTDMEIVLDPKKYILSKTDTKGIIEYGNEYFVEISGYSEEELIGKPHNIIRHPDMPKIVFKLLWQRIKNREDITAIVKNLAKDGRYYWVMTEFDIKVDKVTDEITGYFAYRRAAPRKAIEAIIPLYKKLVEIEKVSGMEGSGKYLTALLESKNMTYDQYINELTGKNSGLMKMWFSAMKKFFSGK
jgi:PAS domain S-box-containing protein